jgi:putative two-component system response regulator
MRSRNAIHLDVTDDAGARRTSFQHTDPSLAPDIVEFGISTVLSILERVVAVAESRGEREPRDHRSLVARVSTLIGLAMGQPTEWVVTLRRAAPLHDLGMIATPDALLQKPGELTREEFDVVKRHTTIGAQILEGCRSPVLRLAHEVALTHHERWDGTGYAGLAGEAIPLAGRIVAVADTFDALTHERPYKRASSVGEATLEIFRGAGTQFDPRVVDAFLSVIEEKELDHS